MCASNVIFFEFLRNIFFRHELLKDEEILENDGSGLIIFHYIDPEKTRFRIYRPKF